MSLPSLLASRWSPWRESDYLAHLSREPESVDVGWAVLHHAKPPVPRSLNTIPLYLSPVSAPPPFLAPSSTPSWVSLTALHPGIDFLPPDKTGPQIAGIPGHVSPLKKVSVETQRRKSQSERTKTASKCLMGTLLRLFSGPINK